MLKIYFLISVLFISNICFADNCDDLIYHTKYDLHNGMENMEKSYVSNLSKKFQTYIQNCFYEDYIDSDSNLGKKLQKSYSQFGYIIKTLSDYDDMVTKFMASTAKNIYDNEKMSLFTGYISGLYKESNYSVMYTQQKKDAVESLNEVTYLLENRN